MTTSTTKYTFESSSTFERKDESKRKHHHHHHHRRSAGSDQHQHHNGASGAGGEDADPTDGSGSLTYSAASSINSAAGESTDSSFADIMRVLDVQDSKELAGLLQQKDRIRGSCSNNIGYGNSKDERSVAESSLAYSTDAESYMMRSMTTENESALQGSEIISTIAGQPSDQLAYDGGGSPPQPPHTHPHTSATSPSGPSAVVSPSGSVGGGTTCTPETAGISSPSGERQDDPFSDDILFSPAEHADSLKRRKDKKRKERKQQQQQLVDSKNNLTPRVKNGGSGVVSSGGARVSSSPSNAASAASEPIPQTREESGGCDAASFSATPSREQRCRSHGGDDLEQPQDCRHYHPSAEEDYYDTTPDDVPLNHSDNYNSFSSRSRSNRSHSSRLQHRHQQAQGGGPSYRGGGSGSRSSPTAKSSAPRPPKASTHSMEVQEEDDDVWYAKWWMFCFPDTHIQSSMSPKR